MEQTIPALIIAAVMIAAGVLLADVTTNSVSSSNESFRQIEAIAEDRLGTDLSITNTAVGGGGRAFQNSPWSPFWEPPEMSEDGVVRTTMSFHEAGEYTLRGRADDGGLVNQVDVTVLVIE